MLGVIRSEPVFLAIFSSLSATCFSVRTQVPGSISQFECKVFLGQDRNAWRYSPTWMRGAFRSEPKFLAISASVNAMRFSARTKIPGDIYQIECAAFSARTAIAGETSQSKCGAFVGQDQNSWQYFPVWMRGVFSQNRNFWRYFPV